MPFVTWTEEFSVDVKTFDEMHVKLIGLLNDLYEAMVAAKGKSVLNRILKELVEYTDYHFKAEEAAMEKLGYPGYERHKAEHEALVARVKAIGEQIEEKRAETADMVMDFLKNWLIDHILRSDKLYGPYLSKKMEE